MTLADRPEQVEPHIFIRGNRATRATTVPRQFLAVLAGDERKPFGPGSGRLELARAIASSDNPLTARVIVNRVWLYYFGAGLVRTPSDFGLRSDPPTHPELLDHLAARLVERRLVAQGDSPPDLELGHVPASQPRAARMPASRRREPAAVADEPQAARLRGPARRAAGGRRAARRVAGRPGRRADQGAVESARRRSTASSIARTCPACFARSISPAPTRTARSATPPPCRSKRCT